MELAEKNSELDGIATCCRGIPRDVNPKFYTSKDPLLPQRGPKTLGIWCFLRLFSFISQSKHILRTTLHYKFVERYISYNLVIQLFLISNN